MKCVFCENGQTRPGSAGFVSKPPESDDPVVKDVPALVCDDCGQEYFHSDTVVDLLEKSVGKPNPEINLGSRRIIITYS